MRDGSTATAPAIEGGKRVVREKQGSPPTAFIRRSSSVHVPFMAGENIGSKKSPVGDETLGRPTLVEVPLADLLCFCPTAK